MTLPINVEFFTWSVGVAPTLHMHRFRHVCGRHDYGPWVLTPCSTGLELAGTTISNQWLDVSECGRFATNRTNRLGPAEVLLAGPLDMKLQMPIVLYKKNNNYIYLRRGKIMVPAKTEMPGGTYTVMGSEHVWSVAGPARVSHPLPEGDSPLYLGVHLFGKGVATINEAERKAEQVRGHGMYVVAPQQQLICFALLCFDLLSRVLLCLALRCLSKLCFTLLYLASLWFALLCFAGCALHVIGLLCFTLLYVALLGFALLHLARASGGGSPVDDAGDVADEPVLTRVILDMTQNPELSQFTFDIQRFLLPSLKVEQPDDSVGAKGNVVAEAQTTQTGSAAGPPDCVMGPMQQKVLKGILGICGQKWMERLDPALSKGDPMCGETVAMWGDLVDWHEIHQLEPGHSNVHQVFLHGPHQGQRVKDLTEQLLQEDCHQSTKASGGRRLWSTAGGPVGTPKCLA